MAPLIIEAYTGLRHDVQYHRVTHFPFTIGRAYDNDLILADDTVSAHHLRLDESEAGITLQNLSTENGTWIGDRSLSEQVEDLRTPLALNLGRVHLKILSTDSAVAPTRNYPHASWLTQWASNIRVAILLLAVYLLVSVYFAFETQDSGNNFGSTLVNEILVIALPLIWATVVGFISRLLLHRWRFALQLSIASISLGLINFSTDFIAQISYWLTNGSIAGVFSDIVLAIAFIGLLTWQLRAVSSLSRKRAAWTSVGIVVPLALIWDLQAIINQPDFNPNPPMHTVLRPNDVRLSTNYVDINDFRQDVEAELARGVADSLQANPSKTSL